MNLTETALKFNIPFIVIQGSDDLFTPTGPAGSYYDKVDAPHKKFVTIRNAGHFAIVTHAGQVAKHLVAR